ncbi:MAG: phosphogluconate dehydratase [Gammaproteobacteria bacterium]|nr:phosphogluconate dehydratase [Gammaproteobacteria bacterium]
MARNMNLCAPTHPKLMEVTERIEHRSCDLRQDYLDMLKRSRRPGNYRQHHSCANYAHAFAALPSAEKNIIISDTTPHLGIVSAYNDMLSAHQPYEHYPNLIRQWAQHYHASAQVAGGVPAMCDGVTQGEEGMELSLFSRDVIALATTIALSHNVYDSVIGLGICDKIVPGLFMGLAQWGHLPALFMPAGPMTSGLANPEKAKIRQQFVEGKIGRLELLQAEQAAYHGPGTCTFYGTANSNQMLMEIMGLHLPGSTFVNPNTPLRTALNQATVKRAIDNAQGLGFGQMLNAKSLVNGIVGLLATGGSTNHTLHLVAMARSLGYQLDWSDFADLSQVIPLIARIYPNGSADINQFQAAGGLNWVIQELLLHGLLHQSVNTVMGHGLSPHYLQEPWLENGQLAWRPVPDQPLDLSILRSLDSAFSAHGGLQVLQGNLGQAIIKTSAVAPSQQAIRAPAIVVDDQKQLSLLFDQQALNRDFVAVVRGQGPKANGMPELHKLTPLLSSLQDRGYRVALVTDGRMSGASGKVPAAIHVCPEASAGGNLGKVRDGDIIDLDCLNRTLNVLVPETDLQSRPAYQTPTAPTFLTSGRSFFGIFRGAVGPANEGACTLFNH